MRPLPNIETLPPRPYGVYLSDRDVFSRAASHGRKAEKIITRLFGKHGRTPHGFYEPLGFIESTRSLAARNRLYSLIIYQLLFKDIARGRIDAKVQNGKFELSWKGKP
jgi:hypothetical protein